MLYSFYIGVKNLLKSEFPKCEFVVHIYTHKDSGFVTRGYHIVTENTNIYEIRNFANEDNNRSLNLSFGGMKKYSKESGFGY